MLSIKSCFCWAHFALFFISFCDMEKAASADFTSVHIGLILDSKSPLGAMVDSCISMAISDFYAVHPDYQSRLILHRKDAMEELDVASAALELMKNDEVHSILSPEMGKQDKFVGELGGRARVPVICFTSRSHSVSYKQSPNYFIQTTPDDSIQAKALASLCKGFGWNSVVILYEDMDYGAHFLAKITRVFHEVVDFEVRVAYTVSLSSSGEDHEIMNELEKLKRMQTRVFLVHMNPALGSRLFLLANQVGMMSEGYAWLVTNSLGNFMHSIPDDVVESMEGVIGLRPHIPKSKNVENFRARWKKNMLLKSPESTETDLNVYGLWAYDTVWALAMAIEKIGPVNPAFLKANSSNNDEVFSFGISQFGPKLLSELQNITFSGLSGEFNLTDGQLNPSALEIFNVYSPSERVIGFWTPERGIVRKLSSKGVGRYSTNIKELKSILWPGDSPNKPKGWAIPSTGKLIVGVPKKTGFTEFVNVSIDPQTGKVDATGFSIDVFLRALDILDFSVDYEFRPFTFESMISSSDTYDDLLYEISNKTFDMVVGDMTILAERSKYVDFTLPYSETGTVMVVKNKNKRDIWIFVKPFRWDLWLLIFSTCLIIGIVLRVLERRPVTNSVSIGQKKHSLGLPFWFPIAALAFPERNMVTNKWSRFVMVIWLLMAFILMQSYTANLSAMLTVDQLDFRFTRDQYVGCQANTFVQNFLVKNLNIDKSRIKEYATVEEYHEAMTKGSENDGIDAIFDEIPYMKLFLDKYNSEYKVVGPTYRTDGFGFAFPRDSPLVIHFSRAILAVTESANMTVLEKKYLGSSSSSSNDPINSISSQSSKLAASDFGGLFIIIGSALVFALLCSETPIGKKVTDSIAKFSQKSFFFRSFRRSDSRVHSINDHGDHDNGNGNGDSSSDEEEEIQGSGNHSNQESRQLGNSSIATRNQQVSEPHIQMSEIGNNTDVSDRQTSLTGKFELVDGKLKPSAFEIFNLIGTGERIVGYWIPEREISTTRDLNSSKELKAIMWPGETLVVPKALPFPATGKLKVGVPKKEGFKEFVNVEFNPLTKKHNISGFSIDAFLASLKFLPFKLDFEFVPFMNLTGQKNGSYNDMLQKILDKTYDFVVGDITILADRAVYVDFTLPYTESGVVMVVTNRKKTDMWIFLKPLSWDLWLTIVVACVFVGLVLRIIERGRNSSTSQREQKVGVFFFPVAALAFPERDMVANKWSKFVLIVWLFMAYVLMQSYTAKLSSNFTVDQLDFVFSEDYFVGHQLGSYVKDFLTNKLHLNESKLRSFKTFEELHDAMRRGGTKGGIDVIAGEIPYMKLFLKRYGSEYQIAGQPYKTSGFGFAFPSGSPLVSHFSKAILDLAHSPTMEAIEKKNFGLGYPNDSINRDNSSLTALHFGGLFIIIYSATMIALFFSQIPDGLSLAIMVSPSFRRCCSRFAGSESTNGSVISSEEEIKNQDSNMMSTLEAHESNPVIVNVSQEM